VKINTSRFGNLEVNNQDIISFNEGLLGFDNLKRYFIVDPGDNTLILWLQSIEDGNIAFPIIEPKIFKPDYTAKLVTTDLVALEMDTVNNSKVYCIITIPSDVTTMTANLKAPIIINSDKKIAKQVVLQDSKLVVNFEMYKELKKYIVNFASDDSRRTTVNIQNTETATHSNLKTNDSRTVRRNNNLEA
jgi:flagellar assembly factor FliW